MKDEKDKNKDLDKSEDVNPIKEETEKKEKKSKEKKAKNKSDKKSKKDKKKKDGKPKKSVRETLSLMVRKKWLTNSTQTCLIVLILIALFIGINVYVQSLDLTDIDVTENKIYTLSDESKKVIAENIDEDVTIYIYGYEEGDTLVSFIKQYVKANDHISYEILTEESNLAKCEEYDLESGYYIVIIETETSSKIIDASYEFYSYDYTTGQEVDLTEQTLTNSLLGVTAEYKPNVYFTTGHNEYSLDSEMTVLSTYLENESYLAAEVNLSTEGAVPTDCDLLVIMAPVSDLLDAEVEYIKNYINEGGNLLVTMDVGNTSESYTNLQQILDLYGVTINHSGYVYEQDTSLSLSSYPSIFMPTLSSSNDITADIYSDGAVWLVYAGRVEMVSDEELEALAVEQEDIMTSSDSALFITDITQSAAVAAESADSGSSTIATILTKTISESDDEDVEDLTSQLLVIANASFITDYKVEQLSSTYPLSYLGNNKDFMLNAVSYLTDREDTLSIRKDMSTSTYTATDDQHTVVLIIIFTVPVVIILAGIVVWNVRRRKR